MEKEKKNWNKNLKKVEVTESPIKITTSKLRIFLINAMFFVFFGIMLTMYFMKVEFWSGFCLGILMIIIVWLNL